MSIEKTIKMVLDKQIRKKYSHILEPSIQFARITKVVESELNDLYNVKLVDAMRNDLEDYSEIPNLRALKGMIKGDIVVIANISSTYQIIGKVV